MPCINLFRTFEARNTKNRSFYFTLAALFFIPLSGTAQSENGYQFTTVVQQKATPVKDQAVSGTCWCFATTSFIESELLRQGKGEYDLSEMFIVRQKYLNT